MTILQDIKAASLTARKAHETDVAASLITLLSEASMIGKNDGGRETTDAETTAVVKKFIKNIDETLNVRKSDQGDPIIGKLILERLLYRSFLPKQMTEEEIKFFFETVVEQSHPNMPKLGDMLKVLKLMHDGQYDGGLAAKLAKEIISR